MQAFCWGFMRHVSYVATIYTTLEHGCSRLCWQLLIEGIRHGVNGTFIRTPEMKRKKNYYYCTSFTPFLIFGHPIYSLNIFRQAGAFIEPESHAESGVELLGYLLALDFDC